MANTIPFFSYESIDHQYSSQIYGNVLKQEIMLGELTNSGSPPSLTDTDLPMKMGHPSLSHVLSKLVSKTLFR